MFKTFALSCSSVIMLLLTSRAKGITKYGVNRENGSSGCHQILSGYRENATQAYKLMKSTSGRSTVSRSLVFKWFTRFEDGRTSMQKEEGRGRKPKINQRLVTSVKEDRRLMLLDLAEKFDMSVGTVHIVLVEKLKMSKVFHLI